MLMPTSIMTEKLARRGLKIDTEFEPDVLRQVSVNETMSHDFAVVSGQTTVSELADRIGRNDPEVTKHAGVFVTDGGDRLAGIVTRSDLLRALEERPGARVVDVASRNLVVTYPDESLYEAAEKMLRADVGRLPVLSREHPGQPIGYLGRSGVLAARLRRLDEEHKLETGWIRRRRMS
jgi:CBS domain-containing protein